MCDILWYLGFEGLIISQKGDGGRKCISATSAVLHMAYILKLQHKIEFHYFHASNSGRSSFQAWLFIYVLSTRFGMLQQIHKKSGSAFLPQTSIWQVQVDVKSTCPFQHQGLDLMHCFQTVDPWCESGWHRNRFGGNGKVPRNWTGWWLNQPIWKILVKMGSSSPNRGENKNIWNHHLVNGLRLQFLLGQRNTPWRKIVLGCLSYMNSNNYCHTGLVQVNTAYRCTVNRYRITDTQQQVKQ